MIATGFGSDTLHSISIANNLKLLGYERILAVSKINDIINKIINILDRKK